MFACSRICFIKNIERKTLWTNEPIQLEPLLFLYPRWFHTSRDRYAERRVPLESPRSVNISLVTDEKDLSNHELVKESLQDGRPNKDSSSRSTKTPNQSSITSIVENLIKRRSENVDLNNVAPNDERIHLNPIFSQKRSSLTDRDRRALKRAAMKRRFQPRDLNWISFTRKLSQIRGQKDRCEGMKFDLRNETILEMTGSLQPNMWIYRVGTPCEVHVLPAVLSKSSRPVILYGSDRAKEVVRQLLLQFEKDSDQRRINKHSLCRTKSSSPTEALIGPYTIIKSPSGPGFQIDSICSFTRYITKLVSERPPRLKYKFSAELHETHNKKIAFYLKYAFSDPQLSQYASIMAFNVALKFVCFHTELGAAYDFLLHQANELGLKFDIQSFNIMLAHAFSNNNPSRVEELLVDMNRTNNIPNGNTWVTLFNSIASPIQRRQTLVQLRNENPDLDSEIVGAVVSSIVDSEFQLMVQSGQDWDIFISRLDEVFGPTWFTKKTFNQMIYFCTRQKKWNLAFKILELVSSRSLKLSGDNLVTLIYLARNKGDLRGALSVLQICLSETDSLNNRASIHHVFMTAWGKRFYNTCRLLWRFAATHGSITYAMQKVVTSSLIKNTTVLGSKSGIWKTIGGKIVVGTDLDTTDFHTKFPLLSKRATTTNPMEWLINYTPNDGTRKEQLALAFMMLQRDLRAWELFLPLSKDTLSQLIGIAYKMDCEWMLRKLAESNDKSDFLEEAIRVPLQRSPISSNAVSNRSTSNLERLKDVSTILPLEEPSPGFETLQDHLELQVE